MNFKKVKISDFLKRIKRSVILDPKASYQLVTVKLHHKGVVLRSNKKGSEIGSKVFEVKSGDFILSGIDARNGAFGIVPIELNGAVVTNDFWYFKVNEELVDIEYFLELTSTNWFDEICRLGSDGTTQRIRLQSDRFFNQEILLPTLEEQKKSLKIIQSIKNKTSSLNELENQQLSMLKILRKQIIKDALLGRLENSVNKSRLVFTNGLFDKEQILDHIKCFTNEYAYISDVFNIEKGETPISKAKSGSYPLIVTAEDRLSSYNYQFDLDNGAILLPMVSSTGHGHASLKRIHFQKGKFALGSILTALIPKNEQAISAKFYYYLLSMFKEELIVKKMKGAANVTLSQKTLKSIVIPVVPYSVQMQAVKIFEYIDELEKKCDANKNYIEQLNRNIIKEKLSSFNSILEEYLS